MPLDNMIYVYYSIKEDCLFLLDWEAEEIWIEHQKTLKKELYAKFIGVI
jgi:hypothetical protein